MLPADIASKKRSHAEAVFSDHSYGQPRAHSGRVRPLRWIFADEDDGSISENEVIDPVSVDEPQLLPYDVEKAQDVMLECERHVNFVTSKRAHIDDDWEAKVSRIRDCWSTLQSQVFHQMVRYLEEEHLARLAFTKNPNEAILRRIHTDRTAKRFRRSLAHIKWEPKLTHWLHITLSDCLSVPLLVAYLDVLQVLRSQVPSLTEQMIKPSIDRRGTEGEALGLLLSRPWDPVIGYQCYFNRPGSQRRAMPNNAVLILAPTCLDASRTSRRWRTWQSHLSALGKVVNVELEEQEQRLSNTVASQYLAAVLKSMRAKVTEVRAQFPHRPIVLLGCGVGAQLVCEVAKNKSIAAMICVGFPVFGLDRPLKTRQRLDEVACPVLFVLGTDAPHRNVEEIQSLRRDMKTESAVLVVGGADDQLLLNARMKKEKHITQSILDRCIQDEIALFLASVLQPNGPELSSEETEGKSRKRPKPIRELAVLGPGPFFPLSGIDVGPGNPALPARPHPTPPSSGRNSPVQPGGEAVVGKVPRRPSNRGRTNRSGSVRSKSSSSLPSPGAMSEMVAGAFRSNSTSRPVSGSATPQSAPASPKSTESGMAMGLGQFSEAARLVSSNGAVSTADVSTIVSTAGRNLVAAPLAARVAKPVAASSTSANKAPGKPTSLAKVLGGVGRSGRVQVASSTLKSTATVSVSQSAISSAGLSSAANTRVTFVTLTTSSNGGPAQISSVSTVPAGSTGSTGSSVAAVKEPGGVPQVVHKDPNMMSQLVHTLTPGSLAILPNSAASALADSSSGSSVTFTMAASNGNTTQPVLYTSSGQPITMIGAPLLLQPHLPATPAGHAEKAKSAGLPRKTFLQVLPAGVATSGKVLGGMRPGLVRGTLVSVNPQSLIHAVAAQSQANERTDSPPVVPTVVTGLPLAGAVKPIAAAVVPTASESAPVMSAVCETTPVKSSADEGAPVMSAAAMKSDSRATGVDEGLLSDKTSLPDPEALDQSADKKGTPAESAETPSTSA